MNWEEKFDQINEGLLESYAAGIARAKEVYDIESGTRDVQSLMRNEAIAESHYYYWDGKERPLEFWLQEHAEDIEKETTEHD